MRYGATKLAQLVEAEDPTKNVIVLVDESTGEEIPHNLVEADRLFHALAHFLHHQNAAIEIDKAVQFQKDTDGTCP